jgi:FMN phosphatase YigB (HAD superfamily)
MKISSILFDLDDTLINTSSTVYPAREMALKAMIDAGLNVNNFNDALKCMERIISFFGSTSYKLIFETIVNEFSDLYDPDSYNEIVFQGIKIYEKYYGNLTTYPDVKSTLDKLISLGKKIGLVSNGDSEIQNQKIINCDLNGYFNKNNTAISSDFGYLWVKPAPYLFEYLAGKMMINLPTSIYIGNSNVDVIGANIAGMISIFYKNDAIGKLDTHKEKNGNITLKFEKPSFQIGKISEILEIIHTLETS